MLERTFCHIEGIGVLRMVEIVRKASGCGSGLLEGVYGYMAVLLWTDYTLRGNVRAFITLLP